MSNQTAVLVAMCLVLLAAACSNTSPVREQAPPPGDSVPQTGFVDPVASLPSATADAQEMLRAAVERTRSTSKNSFDLHMMFTTPGAEEPIITYRESSHDRELATGNTELWVGDEEDLEKVRDAFFVDNMLWHRSASLQPANRYGIRAGDARGGYGIDPETVIKSATHLNALLDPDVNIVSYAAQADHTLLTLDVPADLFGRNALSAGSPGTIIEAPAFRSDSRATVEVELRSGGVSEYVVHLDDWWKAYTSHVNPASIGQTHTLLGVYSFFGFGESLDIQSGLCDNAVAVAVDGRDQLLCEVSSDFTSIVMVTGTIPKGMSGDEALRSGLIESREIPNNIVPDDAVGSLEEISGKIATNKMITNEIVKQRDFTETPGF